jgi:peptidoglycan/xylan/chitin deacetylase (PgdA/CDA1 family)
MNNKLWPGDRKVAVIFNVCLEAWSEGKAPGISPMGNPLPPGVLDNMAISWASYGYKRGIYRLLDIFERQGVKASVMANGVIAERAPQALREIARGGHELLSHSYAMDIIPALLDEEAERANILRCIDLLRDASGQTPVGWLSPRATGSMRSPELLCQAGFEWHGDALDDDLPYIQTFGGRSIVAIPLGTDVNDMPSMKYGAPPSQMLESFLQVLEIAQAASGPSVIDVTNHAHIYGRPRGAYFFEQVVQEAVRSGAWIATRAEVARHVLPPAR